MLGIPTAINKFINNIGNMQSIQKISNIRSTKDVQRRDQKQWRPLKIIEEAIELVAWCFGSVSDINYVF